MFETSLMSKFRRREEHDIIRTENDDDCVHSDDMKSDPQHHALGAASCSGVPVSHCADEGMQICRPSESGANHRGGGGGRSSSRVASAVVRGSIVALAVLLLSANPSLASSHHHHRQATSVAAAENKKANFAAAAAIKAKAPTNHHRGHDDHRRRTAEKERAGAAKENAKPPTARREEAGHGKHHDDRDLKEAEASSAAAATGKTTAEAAEVADSHQRKDHQHRRDLKKEKMTGEARTKKAGTDENHRADRHLKENEIGAEAAKNSVKAQTQADTAGRHHGNRDLKEKEKQEPASLVAKSGKPDKTAAEAENHLAERVLKEERKAASAAAVMANHPQKQAAAARAHPNKPTTKTRPGATADQGRRIQKEDNKETSAPTPAPTTRRPTPNPTQKPTDKPTPKPTDKPTPAPVSPSPTPEPTEPPTPAPVRTLTPLAKPTPPPTPDPTDPPTPEPTKRPRSPRPTDDPTPEPTKRPRTAQPTDNPTSKPTTPRPTEIPTGGPSARPSALPSRAPSREPTPKPTTAEPTVTPTGTPTYAPVVGPTTGRPTRAPSSVPSGTPTEIASDSPSGSPSAAPISSIPTKATLDGVDEDADSTDVGDNNNSTDPADSTDVGDNNNSTDPADDTTPDVDTGLIEVPPTPTPAPLSNEPVPVSTLVRVTLRSVQYTMEDDESEIYQRSCDSFLGELFGISIPPFEGVKCEVTGQKLVTSSRRLNAGEGDDEEAGSAGGIGSNSGNALRRKAQTIKTLYPLEVDTTVTAEFIPTPEHPDAASVDFTDQVRNFFTVSGGFFVEELKTRSAVYETENTDQEDQQQKMEYFEDVRGVEGQDPNASAVGTGGGGAAQVKSDGDGGSDSGWLIAVIVGSVVFVGLVAAILFMMRKKRKSPSGSSSKRASKKTKDERAKPSHRGGDSRSTPSKSKTAASALAADVASPDSPSGALSPRGGESNFVEHVPEEASDSGSLAHLQNLDSMSYAYSLDDGLRISHSVSQGGIGGIGSSTVGYNEVEHDEYEVGYDDPSAVGGGGTPETSPTRASGRAANGAASRSSAYEKKSSINPFDDESVDQGQDSPTSEAQRHSSNLISSVFGGRRGKSARGGSQANGASPVNRGRSEPVDSPQSQDSWLNEEDGGGGGMLDTIPSKSFGDQSNSSAALSKSDMSRLQERLSKRGVSTASAMAPDDATFMTLDTAQGMVRRDCWAPPGKLGVVIDSTPKGPVVHEVKGTSPLEGAIFAGDRIIAVDDNDTRSMTASAVTKMMARKMDQRRKITVLSVVTGAN